MYLAYDYKDSWENLQRRCLKSIVCQTEYRFLGFSATEYSLPMEKLPFLNLSPVPRFL